MKWKSFKQEKPLLGQRILVCDMDFDSDEYKHPSYYLGFYILDEEKQPVIEYKNYMGYSWLKHLTNYEYEIAEYKDLTNRLFWTSVPNLPEDMK